MIDDAFVVIGGNVRRSRSQPGPATTVTLLRSVPACRARVRTCCWARVHTCCRRAVHVAGGARHDRAPAARPPILSRLRQASAAAAAAVAAGEAAAGDAAEEAVHPRAGHAEAAAAEAAAEAGQTAGRHDRQTSGLRAAPAGTGSATPRPGDRGDRQAAGDRPASSAPLPPHRVPRRSLAPRTDIRRAPQAPAYRPTIACTRGCRNPSSSPDGSRRQVSGLGLQPTDGPRRRHRRSGSEFLAQAGFTAIWASPPGSQSRERAARTSTTVWRASTSCP